MGNLLVNFVSDFVRDVPGVRCAVLKNDVEGLRAYGLSDQQIAELRSFDPNRVLTMLHSELLAMGIDLVKKGKEVGGLLTSTPKPPGGGFGLLASQSMYSAEFLHIRGIDPPAIARATATTIVLRGNGFGQHPQIRFTLAEQPEVVQEVLSVSCDVDLYQRVTLVATLNSAGEWKVEARNPPDQDWSNTKNPGKLVVNP